MTSFSYIIIGLIFAPYLVVPFVIWRTHRFSVNQRLRLVHSDFLPTEVAKRFTNLDNPLHSEGFTASVDAGCADYLPGINLHLRLYIHKTENIMAIVSVISDTEQSFIKDFIEFVSKFENNTELMTHNSDIATTPLNATNRTVRAIGHIKDPLILLRIHKHFLSKYDQNALLPESGFELAALNKVITDDLEAQEKLGGLRLNDDASAYVPTLSGALLIAWYNMWPVSWIRKAKNYLQAKIWVKDSLQNEVLS